MHDFTGERRGSAVQWFTVAAAVLCAASLAGARTLDWMSQSGRVALVAYRTTAQPQRVAAGPGVDPTPTGSIPSSKAVLIRIR